MRLASAGEQRGVRKSRERAEGGENERREQRVVRMANVLETNSADVQRETSVEKHRIRELVHSRSKSREIAED